jgi:hypothetical protein
LSASEFDAGERFRNDFERTRLSQAVTMNWDPNAGIRGNGGGVRGMHLGDIAMEARQRLDRAIEAVGPELAGVLLDVCCFLKGLETVEFERKWPRRSAKLILKTALACLARHYDPALDRQQRRATMRHWGSEGFRPDIGARIDD